MNFLVKTGIGAALGGLVFGLALPTAVQAQARLEARYTASLAGITLGEGSWLVDVREDRFSAEAKGSTSGLARFFSSGHGHHGLARGHQEWSVRSGQLRDLGEMGKEVRRSANEHRRRGGQGPLDRAAHGRASRPHPRDGGASPQRARSDDRLASACGGQGRPDGTGGLQAARARSSTAACATI